MNAVTEVDESHSGEEHGALAAEEADEENEPLDEQDAIEVLLSWKETRAKIRKEKLSRSFPTRQDVKKLEARVRCFKCKAVGHFSKNCPKKGSSSSTSSPGKSGVKVCKV